MLNKIILMGRLVADPEIKTTPSGVAVCRFKVAVDRPYQKGKEKQADFIPCTSWRNTAEFVSRYFAKGKMIIAEGSLRNNDYTDKNGIKHYSMDVQVDNVSFGGDKKDDAPSTRQAENNSAEINKTLAEFEEILDDGECPF